jgi:hypothetical protein
MDLTFLCKNSLKIFHQQTMIPERQIIIVFYVKKYFSIVGLLHSKNFVIKPIKCNNLYIQINSKSLTINNICFTDTFKSFVFEMTCIF